MQRREVTETETTSNMERDEVWQGQRQRRGVRSTEADTRSDRDRDREYQ